MEFAFAPNQIAFQREVRQFFETELPPDWCGGGASHDPDEGRVRFAQRLERKMAGKGWLIADFPARFGGARYGPVEWGLFFQEMGYHLVDLPNHIGMNAARLMLAVCSQEQLDRWIPAIARGGEVIYAEGYSEPEAGSDLASLRTTAVRQGGDWVINGQKAWTSQAAYATHLWLLVRTNPHVSKQAGLSIIIADMNTPGIVVKRQDLIDGSMVNDVFLDNVRAPASNLVGEEGRGWVYFPIGGQPASSVKLNVDERARGYANPNPLFRVGELRRHFDDLVDYAREATRNARPLGKDPATRALLADLKVGLECYYLLVWRVFVMQTQGLSTGALGPVSGLFREFPPRLYRAGRELLGSHGLVLRGSRWARLHGQVERLAVRQWHDTHPAGGVNVRRNIAATRGLGLPR